ncbi:hypothetical protein MTO96_022216 [Rhipicephalus appendiculatus]
MRAHAHNKQSNKRKTTPRAGLVHFPATGATLSAALRNADCCPAFTRGCGTYPQAGALKEPRKVKAGAVGNPGFPRPCLWECREHPVLLGQTSRGPYASPVQAT